MKARALGHQSTRSFKRCGAPFAKPAAANFLQQQARFDDFIEVFNNERPHEALNMKCPAEVYQHSTRAYQGLPDIDYPFHDKIIVVTNCGPHLPRPQEN